MSRNTKHKLYKEYLALLRRDEEISKIQANLGYKELDKPVHYGYTARFILREDVARRQDADVFLHLVEKYTTVVWSKHKNFEVKYKRGYIHKIQPEFKYISEADYEKLSEKYKKYFSYAPSKDKKYWDGRLLKHFKCVIPPHYLVIDVRNDYLTHEKVIDGDLISEEKFIDDKLWDIRKKMNPYSDGMKSYGKAENRAARIHNKMALKRNLKHSQLSSYYNDETGEVEYGEDWLDWGYHWMDEAVEFRYQHRHGAKWLRW